MDCKTNGIGVKECVGSAVYADALEIAEAEIDRSLLSGKTVLITGAGGFIGSYLTIALLLRNDLYGDGVKVIALVRNREKAEKKFGSLLSRGDLELAVCDVTRGIDCGAADFIIHAASQASNIQFETDPVGTLNANLAGTANVLDFALKSKSRAVLVVSSLKVYGELYGGKSAICEGDAGYVDFTSYKSCYAVGKRASEALAASYGKQYGLNVKIVRPSYIYGASSLDDDRVWAQFIANAVKGEDILLKSNGAVLRSFCYVTDTARAMLRVLLGGENVFPYNISSEMSNVTIREFAAAVCAAFPERGLGLRFANPADEAEPLKSSNGKTPEVLDNSRLKALGWQPKVTLADGIRRAVATLEENLS